MNRIIGKGEINVDSACDNPIQLIGLYKKLENTDRPYGKHYNRSFSFASYNEIANSREVTKESWKKELTDYVLIHASARDATERDRCAGGQPCKF